ncbi:MAG: DUF58 domain-containing protein [Bacteroidota bacterium]
MIKTFSLWSGRAGVRLTLLLSLIFFWAVSTWLQNEYGQDDSNLWIVMRLLLVLLQWTVVGLFAFSLLSATLIWLLSKSRQRAGRLQAQVTLGDGRQAEAGWAPVSIQVTGLTWRPLLGTVQARLLFSQQRLSERILLDTSVRKPRSIVRDGLRGAGLTLLHDRGIYEVEAVLISFCDMFGLVSLPVTLPYVQQLVTLPVAQPAVQVKAQPHAVEEQKHRIDIPRRVEGEYVNYKEFETGDNIQRIVWKIYAKSGQLVVRIPETKDPYASHLYFYVSYFLGMGTPQGAFEQELLNAYKDRLRNLLEALQRNGYDVRLQHDQEVPRLQGQADKKDSLFQIAAASWQTETPPAAFIQYTKAAFVALPSLVPATEVEIILKNLPLSIPVIVIQLSEVIPSPFQFTFKDIFFRPEEQPTDQLRQSWLLAPLRRELLKNEKNIERLLKQRGHAWLTKNIETDGRA